MNQKMANDDPYNLRRFVEAQEQVYAQVCSELRGGRKRSHWMWYIFAQIKGLGYSAISVKYSISSLDEARAYLDDAVLGPRLLECTRLVNQIAGRSVEDIFGYPDDLKFHSSVTLFAQAAPENQIFRDALQKYFKGEFDQLTLDRIRE
jgi:uncharacterized protein (DUF1810 family)